MGLFDGNDETFFVGFDYLCNLAAAIDKSCIWEI
jgi:hypothetical protein